MSMITGLPVADILYSQARDSFYELKKNQHSVPSLDFFGLRLMATLSKGVQPIIVDNVIATGWTMASAKSIIPSAIPCALAIDAGICSLSVPETGSVTVPFLDAKVFPSTEGARAR